MAAGDFPMTHQFTPFPPYGWGYYTASSTTGPDSVMPFSKEEFTNHIEEIVRKVFSENKINQSKIEEKTTPTKFEIFIEEDGQNPSDYGLFSPVKIRIFYEGENRNGSFIEKSIGDEMLKTVYNIPIVGEFLVEKNDFGGHGGKIIISDQGIEFVETTKPFGVVPSDTRIWWEEVTEKDGTTKLYACCNGLLWTGRYPEALEVIKNSKGQSMELDSNSITGQWELKDGREYFKFTEPPNISALCILGDDIEPCFESSDITATKFNNLEAFKKDLNDMMKDFMIYSTKGGVQMSELEVLQAKCAEFEVQIADLTSTNADYVAQIETLAAQVEVLQSEFSAKEAELTEVQEKYTALQDEHTGLVQFKSDVELSQKEELIEKFSNVLEEEVLDSFKEKIGEFSVIDLEKELSVLAVRKNNFSFTPQVTVPVGDPSNKDLTEPDWLKLVKID